MFKNQVFRLMLATLTLMPMGAFAQGFEGGSPFKAQLSCQNVKDVQQGYLMAHILYNDLNNTLEERTIDRYIKSLDGTKILFTKADVDTIKKEMKGVFAELGKRDCKKLYNVHKLYTQRLEQRAEFVKKTLGKNFKFDKKTRLILDPEKREFAANEKALQELQGKYLQFQVSNYLLSDDKQSEAIDKIKRSYDRVVKKVKDTKEEEILTNYLNAFGHGLDAHTSYFSADMLEDFEITMRLSLQGIGATLTSEDGYTTVEALVKGGAAERSGLVQEKDKIIAVGQYKDGKALEMEDVVEWDLRDVVSRIRGSANSKVRLKLLRKKDGKTTTQTVTLTRAEVKLEDEAASISFVEKKNNDVPHKVGVINLPSFYADSNRGGKSSAADVARLVEEAKKEKADALVLDLSMNGGGSLSDAVELAGLFFATGNVVKQSAPLRNPNMRAVALKDTDPKVNWPGPLVILTSRVSASASEIVAGTLKDYGRAMIVGADHTFGKGTVQQVIPLAQGLGALKVTIGMFFTPGGFSTQHRGVASHIQLPSELEMEEDEIGEKALEYSLPPKQMEPFISPSAFVSTGEGKWEKIEDKMVDTLKKRSEDRVSKDKEFITLKEKIAKKAKESKEIVLEDSFKDMKDKKSENDKKKKYTDAEKKAEYLKRADINEAVNVAVDMVDFKNKVPLKVIAQTGGKEVASGERQVQSAGGKKQSLTKMPGAYDGDGRNPKNGAIIRDSSKTN